VIGNGDLTSAVDVAKRRRETGISGAMIGRAAMSTRGFSTNKILFRDRSDWRSTGRSRKWRLILRHCHSPFANGREEPAVRSMRARLMAYSKGFPGSKILREKFQHVSTLADVERSPKEHLTRNGSFQTAAAALWKAQSLESLGAA